MSIGSLSVYSDLHSFFQQGFVGSAVRVFHVFGCICSYSMHLDALRNGAVPHAHSSCIRTGSRTSALCLRPSQLDLSGVSRLHFSLCPLPIHVPRGLFLSHIRGFPSAGDQRARRSNSLPILLNWWNPVGHTRSQSLTLGTEVPRSECLQKPQIPLKILPTVPRVSRTY